MSTRNTAQNPDGLAASRHRGKRPLRHTDLPNSPEGFDVTAVIGRVQFADTGDHTPHEAAFLIIARHDTPGVYTFPTQDGGTCRVDVSYENVGSAVAFDA